MDTAYHAHTGVRVPDLNKDDIEKLERLFENCANDEEAQYLYDGHINTLTRAHNAVRETSHQDRFTKLNMANCMSSRDQSRLDQVCQYSGMNVNVNSTSVQANKINAKHGEIERDNNEYYKDRVSDLNVAAVSYRNYENLYLQRDNEYYDMLHSDNVSDTGSSGFNISVA